MLHLTCIMTDDGFQILDVLLDGMIQPPALASVELPSGFDPSRGVVISGRIPVWLFSHLCCACRAHPWVATFDPRIGGIVVTSASADIPPGSIIDNDRITRHLPQPALVKRSAKSTAIPGPAVCALLGPPHSGKSVFLNALRKALSNLLPADEFQRDVFVIRACPDGEGDWSSEVDQSMVTLIRRTTAFTDEFINEVSDHIQRVRESKALTLVDCGGRIDRKNQQVLNLCTHAIIVSSTPQAFPEWRGAAKASDVIIAAEITSSLDAVCTIHQRTPLIATFGPLDRATPPELPVEFTQALLENLPHAHPDHTRR